MYAKIANIVKNKYCNDNIPKPLWANKGTAIKSPIIHKVQFSIFFKAMYHIAVKKIPDVKISI
jgi:hypothetical protein